MSLARCATVSAFVLFAGSMVPSLTGCAPEEESDGASTASESAYTVESGDRFIVSATPTKVVLKKRVDGVKFPFDEKSLLGKALLIHPVEKRADNGVYARAKKVRAEGERYVVESEPLTFSEMRTIEEDDVVRIFVDARARNVRAQTHALKPQNASTSFTSPLDFTTYVGLGSPAFMTPGVTFNHSIQEASFKPEVLADYQEATGIELGMRASLHWRSTLKIGGRLGGTFFKSTPLETPPYVVFVPIGFFPVPVSLSASAYVVCSALVEGPAELSVAIAADAEVGASMRVNPSLETAPATWIREGQWPAVATGSASLDPDLTMKAKGAVRCVVPRVELKALVAGVSGPYLAVSPTFEMGMGTMGFTATVGAGIMGELFGHGLAAELPLLTWTPNL